MSNITTFARLRSDGVVVRKLPDGSEEVMVSETNLADAPVPPDKEGMTDEQLARLRPLPPVKRLRWSLSLSQAEFAKRYRIPLGTLRDWEQGRTEPDAPARAYIEAISKNPEMIWQSLAS
jgi:putative transcriptional regulator